ncbi:MAG: hypothetical protein IAI50_11005 [Candidatus Eremiobacteraeota bacterium]|nr:hypothetical protein [Candidatus Eremiobacteraeota bacterium]
MYRPRIQTILGLAAALLGSGCAGGGSVPQMSAVSAPTQSTAARTSAFGAKSKAFARRMNAVAGPAGFAAMRVDLNHNTIADDGMVVANYAKQYGISTIFLQVHNDDIALLEAQDPQTVANLNAMFNVATVYIMTGDPTWLATPTTVPSDVTAIVRKIAPAYPQFAGILYNIVPTSSQGAAYFQLLDTLLAGSQPYAFGTTIVQTAPGYWRLPGHAGNPSPSMMQDVQGYAAVTQTYFEMQGGSATAQMTNDVTKALPQITKPYWSGADAVTKTGYLGQSSSYLSSNLSTTASNVSAINPLLNGISIDEWNDGYSSLQTILAQPLPAPIPQPSAPLVPAMGQTYIGAYVDPNKTGNGPTAVATFESQIGRKLAYDLHYIGFTAPFVGSNTNDDLANGRAPLIAWNCGDTNANVAAGKDDAMLQATAAGAAAYGHPIFVRFLWEMNLPLQGQRGQCYDPNTDLPNHVLSPARFIAAWRHIHSIFVAAHATNVIWVWNESGSGANPAGTIPATTSWIGSAWTCITARARRSRATSHPS